MPSGTPAAITNAIHPMQPKTAQPFHEKLPRLLDFREGFGAESSATI